MTLTQNRKAIPQAGIVCGTCDTEFRSPALQCQSCTICYHPTCAEIPLYYMVEYAQSTIQFLCKQCTEQLVEPHWTDSRIESQTVNTEETPNERAEEDRSQSDDNEHETHQVEPTCREAAIATTEEPQNEERRQRLRKINAVCNFCKKKACRHCMIGVRNVNSCIQPHAENIWKTPK